DVTLWGHDPRMPHLENVVFHATNVLLLLAFLARTTGALAPSLAVAALFALHPLRVESVAWIAERKDVLSVFFGLLTLHAWVGYARCPGAARYLLALGLAACAMLSKPMLVTLPVLLFLVDLWPLRRHERGVTLRGLAVEKVPFAILAGATAA